MHHDPAILHLIQRVMSIIAGFNITVSTHTAAEMRGIIQHFITAKSLLINFSITLFDLKDRQVVLHNSVFNEYFHSPIFNHSIRNNLDRLFSLTCPLNIRFCLQTELIITNYLQKLTTEQLQGYNAQYVRLLMEKDGQYHPYIIYLNVFKFDEFGRPWILKIETIRSQTNDLSEFRCFSHTLEGYTEVHAYSKHLQNLKLTENEKTVLKLLIKDKTQSYIGKVIDKKPSAVQSYYTIVEQKIKVTSVQEVKEIGRVLGY